MKLYLRFIGLFSFLLWTLFLLAFVLNTSLVFRNIGYLLWHAVHFILIILVANVASTRESFNRIFRWYMHSFVFLAWVGIVQFTLGVMGFDFFVEQWWTSTLPRVNGLSYEPSYYATYILIGWTISFSLLIGKFPVFSKRKSLSLFVLLTISILLSTSRMGILFMVVVCTVYFCSVFIKIIFKSRLSRPQFVFLIFFAWIGLLSITVITPLILTKYKFLLAGTGVQGQSAHSAVRFDIMKVLFDIFWSNPFSGVSLGGIPSAVGTYYGEHIKTIEEAKKFEGINIFLEVLVASGGVGFMFFLFYLVRLFRKTISIKKRLAVIDLESAAILSALILSLAVELLILCFNQNILRLYLWIHIAMLNAAYFAYKKRPLGN